MGIGEWASCGRGWRELVIGRDVVWSQDSREAPPGSATRQEAGPPEDHSWTWGPEATDALEALVAAGAEKVVESVAWKEKAEVGRLDPGGALGERSPAEARKGT